MREVFRDKAPDELANAVDRVIALPGSKREFNNLFDNTLHVLRQERLLWGPNLRIRRPREAYLAFKIDLLSILYVGTFFWEDIKIDVLDPSDPSSIVLKKSMGIDCEFFYPRFRPRELLLTRNYSSLETYTFQ